MRRFGVAILAAALAGALLWIACTMPAPEAAPGARIPDALAQSGVNHPVTAVLLVFRAYDTLLEVGVLLLAVLGAASAQAHAEPLPAGQAERASVLSGLVRMLLPVILLVAGYLLWAGSSHPGGAFQAGAVLGAAGVMLRLAGMLPSLQPYRLWVQIGLVAGFQLFLLVSVAALAAGAPWLGYPRAAAGPLVLLIETALTVSIALSLLSLFMNVPQPTAPRPGTQTPAPSLP